MANDADIIRCASPWPGLAAQLLEAWVGLDGGTWAIDRLCASASGLNPGDAAQVLGGLALAGVCTANVDETVWSTPLNRDELLRLSNMLRGAEHFRRLRVEAPNLEFAVTMPMSPSFLQAELPEALGRPGGYLATRDALDRVAMSACSRLVVMTPFLDRGFGWLQAIFASAGASVRRVLVLRDLEKYSVEIGIEHSHWIKAQQVSIYDYHMSHSLAAGRALPIETFHAKIVLADDNLAYVGSANIQGSGTGTSLEAGFIVDGHAAGQVARLIDGVLRVAKHI